jgi:tape measure domain-containing protein
MIGGEIKVVMSLDPDGQFGVQVQKAQKTVDELKSSMLGTSTAVGSFEQSFKNAGSTIHDTVVTLSLARFALEEMRTIFLSFPEHVMETTAEFERMHTMLEGLTGSTKGANDSFNFLFNMAQRAPFDIKALTDTFVKLKAGGLDPMDGSMQAVIDSVAKFGGGSEQLKSVSLALQEMGDKGVVSLKELRRQLGQQIPGAIRAMAIGLNMSVAQLDKEIKTGTLEATDSAKRMLAELEIENQGSAARMMTTWNGMVEQLKSKWQMFENDIGKDGSSGMFDQLKGQLQELLNAFNGTATANLRASLGDGLSALTDQIIVAKNAIIEFWSEIKTAGEIFIAYFAASKIAGGIGVLADGLNRINTLTRDSIALKTAENQANEMNAAKARYAVAAIHADKAEALAAEAKAQRDADVAEADSQTALLQKKLDANKAEVASKLEAIKAMEAEELIYREKQEIWEQAAAQRYAQKSKGTNAAGGAYAAKAGENQMVAESLVILTQAEREEIAAIRAKNALIIQEIAAKQALRAVVTQEVAVLEAEAAMEARLAAETAAVTMGTIELTVAQKAAQAVAAAGSFIWSAMGGWMGVLTAAIMAGVYAWQKWKEAAELAEGAADRAMHAKMGLASTDELEKTTKNLGNLRKELADLQEQQEEAKTGVSSDGQISGIDSSAKAMEARAAKIKEIQAAIAADTQTAAAFQQNIVRADGEQLGRAYAENASREVEAIGKAYSDKRAAIIQGQKDEEEAKQKSQAQIDADGKIAQEKLTKLSQEESDLQAKAAKTALDGYRARAEAFKAANAGTTDVNTLKEIQAQATALDLLNEKYNSSLKLADTASKFTTPDVHVASDKNYKNPTDPLVKALDKAQAEMEIAKEKMANIMAGATTLQQMRAEAAEKVLGDAAGGAFDYRTKGADGKETEHKVGSDSDRQKWVEQFAKVMQTLPSNANDADAAINKFINSLNNVSAIDKQRIRDLITYRAAQEEENAQIKIAADMQRLYTDAKSAMISAQRNAADPLNKESAAMQKLRKDFADLAQKAGESGESLAEFDEKLGGLAGNALAAQSMADLLDRMAKTEKELDDYKQKPKNENTEEQTASIQKQIDQVNKLMAAEMAKSQLIIDNTNLEVGARAAAVDAQVKLESDAANQIALIWAKAQDQYKTGLDKLKQEWQDTTAEMNKASTEWANKTIDTIQTIINGGKVNFKALAVSWLQEIEKMALQKTLGNAVTDLMGTLGSSINGLLKQFGGLSLPGTTGGSGALGPLAALVDPTTNSLRVLNVAGGPLGPGGTPAPDGSGGAGAAPGATDPQAGFFTKLESGFSSVWQNMTSGFKGLWQDLQNFISVLTTAGGSGGGSGGGLFGSLYSSIFGGGGGGGGAASSAVNGGDASILGSSGEAFEMFATGGIMTSMGKLPLRKYSGGGIANSPQMAMFGEGSTPEAYVPLPNGNSIPVTMQGGGKGGDQNITIQINVAQDGTSTTNSQGDSKQQYTNLAAQVKATVQAELVKQQRPGGLIYQNRR